MPGPLPFKSVDDATRSVGISVDPIVRELVEMDCVLGRVCWLFTGVDLACGRALSFGPILVESSSDDAPTYQVYSQLRRCKVTI